MDLKMFQMANLVLNIFKQFKTVAEEDRCEFNPTTRVVEAGGSLSLRSVWSTEFQDSKD